MIYALCSVHEKKAKKEKEKRKRGYRKKIFEIEAGHELLFTALKNDKRASPVTTD